MRGEGQRIKAKSVVLFHLGFLFEGLDLFAHVCGEVVYFGGIGGAVVERFVGGGISTTVSRFSVPFC